MSRVRTFACLLGCCLLAALLVSASASARTARHPWYGLYQCTGTDGMPLSAFRLRSHGRYVFGMSRNGQKLNDPVPGRWKLKGKQVLFQSGVFKRSNLMGVWFRPGAGNTWPKGYIALRYAHGGFANIGCYPQLKH